MSPQCYFHVFLQSYQFLEVYNTVDNLVFSSLTRNVDRKLLHNELFRNAMVKYKNDIPHFALVHSEVVKLTTRRVYSSPSVLALPAH